MVESKVPRGPAIQTSSNISSSNESNFSTVELGLAVSADLSVLVRLVTSAVAAGEGGSVVLARRSIAH